MGAGGHEWARAATSNRMIFLGASSPMQAIVSSDENTGYASTYALLSGKKEA